MKRLLSLALLAAAPQAAPPVAAPAAMTDAPVPVFVARVVARYPHDTGAFTEGLLYRDGALYESIGLEGRSEVRRVSLVDGRVTARARIPASEFGEGLAAWGEELVSLTWHGGVAHRWDVRTLRPRGNGRFTGEGWGLTSDAAGFVQSDGTATLRFLDPRTLAVHRTVTVTLRGRPVTQVNELEAVDGALFANVWHTPYLLRIDPATGRVTAVVDLRPVVAQVQVTDPEAVANGIAWDAAHRRLFVTGKLWPALFEIALDPATPPG
ncbi:glutaminyl-peptide cyclotransferase [Sphingomonas sp.]|uniref:glutaminyl-peptide cyclotransferase n=1 Tax=Sphingomonas sp. TaxID=28214 RepID=UPI003CC664F2